MDIEIIAEEVIWHPGSDYDSRKTVDYDTPVTGLSEEEIIERVQRRASEDGEWCIASGLVGKNNENEPKMRKMMAFVSDPKQIKQCLSHIAKEGEERTVDYVCRELANASKWATSVKR